MKQTSPNLRKTAGLVISVVGGLLAVAVLGALAAYLTFRASLPDLDGEVSASGLSAAARIERDDLGVPTVRAGNRLDLAFATGYAHAQDRYFQMDLQRRLAAGELAELLGPAAVATDRAMRLHQFATVAEQVLAQASATERSVLDAYAAGVNASLARLGARPWEYFVLGSRPRPWQPRDSLLVAFAMYVDLNDSSGERELANAAIRATLPAGLYQVLYPLGSEWDAPVDGGTWRLPPLPDARVLNLREGAAKAAISSVPVNRELTDAMGDAAFGSNAWAVSGALTANGQALLANDMHLGLQVPNIWYRARLIVDSPSVGNARDLIGVTLPGLPLIIAGSNGHVAWGFTNTHGDWTDLIEVQVDPTDSSRYLTAAGPVKFARVDDVILVRGQPAESMTTTQTIWGPIVAKDAGGTPLALAWTAHRPEATNLHMMELESVRSVDAALEVANRSGAPVQNFVTADDSGSIGWTLFGQVPVREGYDSRFPSQWARAATGWTRWRAPEEYPRIVNPLGGRLWTANSRAIEATTWLGFVGPGNYVLGARAGQIRDGLLALDAATAADMLAIQLDDRALFLSRWRDLLLQLLIPEALEGHPDRQAARKLVENWSGRAAVEDPGYLVVRSFRRVVMTATFNALVAQAKAMYPDIPFEPGPQFEGSLWQMVTERPQHLLDPRHATWHSALLDWTDRALLDLRTRCGELADCAWGRDNVLAMRHPLSRALPWAAWLIDMPREALPGDSNMPRVQGPRQGASERFVVTPGRESEGYFEMPGGQSAHPLSPYFAAGHDSWVTGQPQPLLPGQTRHTLRLVPGNK